LNNIIYNYKIISLKTYFIFVLNKYKIITYTKSEIFIIIYMKIINQKNKIKLYGQMKFSLFLINSTIYYWYFNLKYA
jgi:hypothetical protein